MVIYMVKWGGVGRVGAGGAALRWECSRAARRGGRWGGCCLRPPRHCSCSWGTAAPAAGRRQAGPAAGGGGAYGPPLAAAPGDHHQRPASQPATHPPSDGARPQRRRQVQGGVQVGARLIRHQRERRVVQGLGGEAAAGAPEDLRTYECSGGSGEWGRSCVRVGGWVGRGGRGSPEWSGGQPIQGCLSVECRSVAPLREWVGG